MIVSIISYSLSQVIEHAKKNESGQPKKQFRASIKTITIPFKLCMYYFDYYKSSVKIECITYKMKQGLFVVFI